MRRYASACLCLLLCWAPIGQVLAQSAEASAPRTDSFEVLIAIQATCTVVAADDIDFGTQFSTPGQIDQTGNINVWCTRGTEFQLGLDGGTTNRDVKNRGMTNLPTGGDAAVKIPYTLSYDSFGGANWGNSSGTWFIGTGAGLGDGDVVRVPVYARATLSGQEPAGTYSDTVTATLTY